MWLITKRSWARRSGFFIPQRKFLIELLSSSIRTVSSGGECQRHERRKERWRKCFACWMLANWRTLPCNWEKAKKLARLGGCDGCNWSLIIEQKMENLESRSLAIWNEFQKLIADSSLVILKREWSRQPLRKPPVRCHSWLGEECFGAFGNRLRPCSRAVESAAYGSLILITNFVVYYEIGFKLSGWTICTGRLRMTALARPTSWKGTFEFASALAVR